MSTLNLTLRIGKRQRLMKVEALVSDHYNTEFLEALSLTIMRSTRPVLPHHKAKAPCTSFERILKCKLLN